MSDSAVKAKKLFLNNAGYVAVLLVAAIYVAQEFINIDKSGRTVYQILFNGFINMAVGFLIASVLGYQGVLVGERNEKVLATDTLHGQTIDRVARWSNRLPDWCEGKTKKALILGRTRLLQREGISYDEVFGDNNNIKNFIIEKPANLSKTERKLFKKQQKARQMVIKKAKRFKVTPLTESSLTTDGSKANDPFNFGPNKAKFLANMNIKTACMKVVLSLILGYYMVNQLKEFSWAVLIWALVPPVIYTVFGMLKFFSSYMFMVDTYRQSKVRKINYLEEFKAEMEQEDKKNESKSQSNNIDR